MTLQFNPPQFQNPFAGEGIGSDLFGFMSDPLSLILSIAGVGSMGPLDFLPIFGGLFDWGQTARYEREREETLSRLENMFEGHIEAYQEVGEGLPRYELGAAPPGGEAISKAPGFSGRGTREAGEVLEAAPAAAAVDPIYLGDYFDVGTKTAEETRGVLTDLGIVPEGYFGDEELYGSLYTEKGGGWAGGRLGKGGKVSLPRIGRGQEWGVGQTSLVDIADLTAGAGAGKEEALGYLDTGLESALARGEGALLEPGTLVSRAGIDTDLSDVLSARLGGISEAARASSALAQQEIAGNVARYGNLENVMREQNLADFMSRREASFLGEQARGNIALEEAALQRISAGLTAQEAAINQALSQAMMGLEGGIGSQKADIAKLFGQFIPSLTLEASDLNRIINAQNLGEKMTLAQFLGGLTQMEESGPLNALMFKDEAEWRRAQMEAGLLGGEAADLSAIASLYSPTLIPQQLIMSSLIGSLFPEFRGLGHGMFAADEPSSLSVNLSSIMGSGDKLIDQFNDILGSATPG